MASGIAEIGAGVKHHFREPEIFQLRPATDHLGHTRPDKRPGQRD